VSQSRRQPKGIGDTVIGSQQLVEMGFHTHTQKTRMHAAPSCKAAWCLKRATTLSMSQPAAGDQYQQSIRSFRTLKFTNFNFDSAPSRWLFYFAFFIPNFAILTKL
jgi:hypothetical protein